MKAKASAILNQAARARDWVPESALSDRDLWTPKLVKLVLVEAERRSRKTARRWRPRGSQAFWPEYMRDVPDPEASKLGFEKWMTADRLQIVEEGWIDGDGVKQPQWLAGPLLGHTDLRVKLVEWVSAVIRDESSKMLCEREGWVYTTFCTHRDRAAGIIAQRLNAAKFDVWPELVAPPSRPEIGQVLTSAA